jgi:hypothetical protein
VENLLWTTPGRTWSVASSDVGRPNFSFVLCDPTRSHIISDRPSPQCNPWRRYLVRKLRRHRLRPKHPWRNVSSLFLRYRGSYSATIGQMAEEEVKASLSAWTKRSPSNWKHPRYAFTSWMVDLCQLVSSIWYVPSPFFRNAIRVQIVAESSLIHLNLAGTHLVVVNTIEAALELFDKRSAIYSDRVNYIYPMPMWITEMSLIWTSFSPAWLWLQNCESDPAT